MTARGEGRTFPFRRPDTGAVMFGDEPVLEGILEWPDPGRVRGGVVVAHPHPLHGGTMAQPVVYRCAQACREVGCASLRFNFRGVGGSSGEYSGREEYRDVVAAASYLRGRVDALAPGGLGANGGSARKAPLVLAGYSFGSVMSAVAAPAVAPDALVLIGFAVQSELFPEAALDRLRGFPHPVLAVCGEHDDIAPPGVVEGVLRELGVEYDLSVILGTGHFFEGRQREVGSVVAGFLERHLD